MQQDIQLQFLYLCALALISPIYTFGIEKQSWTVHLFLARRWDRINLIPSISDHFPITPNVALTPVVPQSEKPKKSKLFFFNKVIDLLTCQRELHPNGQHDQKVAIQVRGPTCRRELVLSIPAATDRIQMACLKTLKITTYSISRKWECRNKSNLHSGFRTWRGKVG